MQAATEPPLDRRRRRNQKQDVEHCSQPLSDVIGAGEHENIGEQQLVIRRQDSDSRIRGDEVSVAVRLRHENGFREVIRERVMVVRGKNEPSPKDVRDPKHDRQADDQREHSRPRQREVAADQNERCDHARDGGDQE